MKLETLSLENYRNFSHLKLDFTASLNILIGNNAQGKSNLLESIYLLAYSKSPRTSNLNNVVKHGFQITRIEGEVCNNEIKKELVLLIDSGNKHLFVDKKIVELKQYLSNLHVIFYVPFSTLIYGFPRERRRYLDRAIVSLDKKYLHAIASYNRILKMRNALFKSKYNEREMESWNEQFINYAVIIWKARQEYIENLCKKVGQLKPIFFKENDEIEIGLKTTPQLSLEKKRWAEEVKYCMEMQKEREKQMGFTIIGPHRDDMVILLNNYDARYFGSSGQLKAMVILMILAQLNMFHEEYEEYPLLMCDDIDTELDAMKLNAFLSSLSSMVQVFLTTTQNNLAETLKDAVVYQVHEGVVEKIRKG
ncbi:MAG: hypothetical protein A2Y62_14890 [Candidatus Fischerbacteria bacterium RBG_13_37_8]|uniref:DNA replication and repair protein RecF n=1 Tax=Candidatus Fischerbacteria bacterium RBG_13_37_8 TaxID=1817863 RepID=A0A1F5V4P6_9BACT|nr:MAG: hypothetical protein A2Y62_14890 [Candidatus Fischerbacteria bacterium RBG_13_37_8]